mmetsp:Transcript_7207/g.13385  ORF Transcript_7207/g.13385 Transcript_7207/m.13385 type:complete len:197 (+) Transcript_7207:62-652(+)|eukprot:CAMPEP_0197522668 /NCGR_PEP_ID=MMETSP1318-20131121/7766_1 /TAXON_ID=552666 /ORGANISM="Partenskyella glossopodia, Strain RCC365" /LENGTH=196 /DNA_ID=CAMNT_0043075107 /DNA_START=43 /DNA_END=633 /DNA_ORIENTATION=+
MAALSGKETQLLMRILERCVEQQNNPKWRSIPLDKVKGKLSEQSLIVLQQAGFERTDTHMLLPMTAKHDRQVTAVYQACLESIEYEPRHSKNKNNNKNKNKSTTPNEEKKGSGGAQQAQQAPQISIDTKSDSKLNKTKSQKQRPQYSPRYLATLEKKDRWDAEQSKREEEETSGKASAAASVAKGEDCDKEKRADQ